MDKIIGREPEINILDCIYHSPNASMIAIYGRRRIGKTYLINHYFQEKGVYLEITGSKDANLEIQLRNFYQEFINVFPYRNTKSAPKDWSEAFFQLKSSIAELDNQRKVIVFLDELPWLASPRSGFLPALEYSWNRHLSRMPNVIVILCGSAASWMIENIINNKAGLYGRLNAQIPIYPFDLSVTEKYLKQQNVQLTRKQIVELYMAIGGVGKYLSLVEPAKSVPQIISQLFFSAQGPLFLEFHRLYQSLFDSAEKHLSIVRILSKKRYGLLQRPLLEKANLPQSGTSSMVLRELEESGFISSLPMFGKEKKERKFKLIDEFSYFYLNWVEPIHSDILRGSNTNYWEKMYHSHGWLSWAGFAFETICLKNISKIKKALGIASVNTVESHWENSEAEIDLLIDRADDVIHLCEIKFSNTEFIITKNYAEILLKKKEAFREHSKTKKAIFITLITPYGVKENIYSRDIVQNEVLLNDLF